MFSVQSYTVFVCVRGSVLILNINHTPVGLQCMLTLLADYVVCGQSLLSFSNLVQSQIN